jgi:ergothioneine biosynthesis protein EgtB
MVRAAYPPTSRPVPTEAEDDARAESALQSDYWRIRSTTEALCAPLEIEDYVVQGTPETSPPKWHLAHTTWFFETFLLVPFAPRYELFRPAYGGLFNSYYQSMGVPLPRTRRALSRPTVREVFAYRHHVDGAIRDLLEKRGDDPHIAALLEWGLQHEQQHQELLLMDILRNFSINPLRPIYDRGSVPGDTGGAARTSEKRDASEKAGWVSFDGGNRNLGHEGSDFCFDNETPRHIAYLAPYLLADRLVTCGEYLAFMEDGGYKRPELWLSDGWECRLREGWEAPLYWEREHGGGWQRFSLTGLHEVDANIPVCNVSFYEADAYARWAGARLPTEGEWENAVGGDSEWKDARWGSNFLERESRDPVAVHATSPTVHGLRQTLGDVWEWTQSAYAPYPGYHAPEGPLGEYNGKFMNNQRVLRGGSFATPAAHIRPSYRNFYRPEDRWAFTGVRLCR